MKSSAFAVRILGAYVMVAAGPAFAHHSFAAEFDASKPVKLSGTVTKIEWMNPHAYLYLNVADEETGDVTNWAIELGSPSGLRRHGWQRTTVSVGDVLTIEGTLGRFKANLANARSAMLERTGERLGAASSEGGQ